MDVSVEVGEYAQLAGADADADAEQGRGGSRNAVDVDEEGKATVLLDGGRSYDPDGTIEGWAWEDGKGVVIGDTPQIRVRIASGVHVFHLTVTDDRGASTKSTITVQAR